MTIDEMKKRKQELGYSNEELSRLSGVPVGTLQKIFGGSTKAPRHSTIAALEKCLEKPGDKTADRTVDKTVYKTAGDRERNLPGANMLAEPSFVYGTSPKREKQQGEYTLEDYYALPDERRVELIDGVIYDMSAPTSIHQAISAFLFNELTNFVNANQGNCMVFSAPFDVQLDMDDRTMVQPDIVVICDRDRLKRRGCYGAPDMAVEILSPSTSRKDCLLKLGKYMDAGVRTYWIVDPDRKRVMVYPDLAESLIPVVYDFNAQVPVSIWENRCVIDFAKLYDRIGFLYELEE